MHSTISSKPITNRQAQVSAVEQNFKTRISDHYHPDRIIRTRHQAEIALMARQISLNMTGSKRSPAIIENAMIALHIDRATRAALIAAEATNPFDQAYHRHHALREFQMALLILERPKHRHTAATRHPLLRRHDGAPFWSFSMFGRCDRCGVRLTGKRSLHLPNAGLHFCAQCGQLEMIAYETLCLDQP